MFQKFLYVTFCVHSIEVKYRQITGRLNYKIKIQTPFMKCIPDAVTQPNSLCIKGGSAAKTLNIIAN